MAKSNSSGAQPTTTPPPANGVRCSRLKWFSRPRHNKYCGLQFCLPLPRFEIGCTDISPAVWDMATEADTCRKFVVPKLQAAGWDSDPHSIAEQRSFTDGRIIVRGGNAERKKKKRADRS